MMSPTGSAIRAHYPSSEVSASAVAIYSSESTKPTLPDATNSRLTGGAYPAIWTAHPPISGSAYVPICATSGAHVAAVLVDEPLLDASVTTWGAFTDLAAAADAAG